MENGELAVKNGVTAKDVASPPRLLARLWATMGLKVQQRVALGFVFLIGVACILGSKKDESWTDIIRDVFKEVGVLFVSVTPIILIYENILRNHMHAEMEKSIKKAFGEAELERKVLTTIRGTLSPGAKRVDKLGISDGYKSLALDNVKRHLHALTPGTVVTVSNVYIPTLKHVESSKFMFSDAIEKGCEFHILLHDPDDDTGLAKRFIAKDDRSTLKETVEEIKYNLTFLYDEWRRLNEWERSKLTIRLHKNFLSVASWRFGDYFIIGYYLYGKSAVAGTQLKVEKYVSGAQSPFFLDLEIDFDRQWKMAQKQIDFSKNGPGPFDMRAVIEMVP